MSEGTAVHRGEPSSTGTWPTRILIAHNAYQHRGGEDSVVAAEAALLESRGHRVLTYSRDNADIESSGKLATGAAAVWSARTRRDFDRLVAEFKPDLVHVHNTWPLISPSIYWAAAQARIPVVQTLHNYRLFCLQAMFSRAGRICEDCLGSLPWRGVLRGCYRKSTSQSAALAAVVGSHRLIGTFRHKVAHYIALTEFARSKYVAGGIPSEKITVKPNFAEVAAPDDPPRSGLLFVGRLSSEKGLDLLLGLMERLPDVHVDVIGIGPEQHKVENHPRITLHGWQSEAYIHRAMRRAELMVLPSTVYENFPRTLVEAFGNALPVVAGRLGAMPELIVHGRTGFLYEYHSLDSLVATVTEALANPAKLRRMGQAARVEYEGHYTSNHCYAKLMSIYAEARVGASR